MSGWVSVSVIVGARLEERALLRVEALRQHEVDEVLAEQRGAADHGAGALGDAAAVDDRQPDPGLVAVERDLAHAARHDVGDLHVVARA